MLLGSISEILSPFSNDFSKALEKHPLYRNHANEDCPIKTSVYADKWTANAKIALLKIPKDYFFLEHYLCKLDSSILSAVLAILVLLSEVENVLLKYLTDNFVIFGREPVLLTQVED